ncbi:Arc family DNA-binding protein [Klebsiella aerogenes]|uniref:Arc family DNA-binding protein n=1 Tax=Klebsiella aerogenes TaxID=548 RepID=UPI0018C2176B|nr:Arc family DNA-binding protein [Klebsiella aerogenes]MBF9782943.1 Arc family DNA-binding protein [Klebsiella aerogenes]MBF9797459.1 Arc family DNA-binding protein [Klebsiella aerogenes]
MTKYPSQLQDKFNLRFPDGMRDAIAERAKANGRSMNSEIIDMIGKALVSPSLNDEEFVYMLEVATKEHMSEQDKILAESTLLQMAEKLTEKIERDTSSLKQVIAMLSGIKKTT